MQMFKVADWALILLQGLFILWRIIFNFEKVYEIKTYPKSPFVPEILMSELTKHYYIMIIFFVVVAILTGLVIANYSRTRILTLIGCTLIMEYILALYLW